jgi:hypothetical protein
MDRQDAEQQALRRLGVVPEEQDYAARATAVAVALAEQLAQPVSSAALLRGEVGRTHREILEWASAQMDLDDIRQRLAATSIRHPVDLEEREQVAARQAARAAEQRSRVTERRRAGRERGSSWRTWSGSPTRRSVG